jgi:hypothetical protein
MTVTKIRLMEPNRPPVEIDMGSKMKIACGIGLSFRNNNLSWLFAWE